MTSSIINYEEVTSREGNSNGTEMTSSIVNYEEVTSREGSSNGTEMTSSIVNYEEVTSREGNSNGTEMTSSIVSYTRRSEGAKLQKTRHVYKSVACCKLSRNYKLTTLPL
jgi:hypothetical protein